MVVGFMASQTHEGTKACVIRQESNVTYITTIDWPPSSPDLNPIENVWLILKQRLRNRRPHGGWSLIELKEAVQDIWENEIRIEDFNHYIDSLPERLQLVRLRKGAQTH